MGSVFRRKYIERLDRKVLWRIFVWTRSVFRRKYIERLDRKVLWRIFDLE
jgi:hypothetical protein